MVANLSPEIQIVIACVLGISAGAIYYIVGAWLLSRRSLPVEAEPEDDPVVPHQLPPLRTEARDEATSRFVAELRRDT